MLAKSKLNSISHEEFIAIFKEKDKYEKNERKCEKYKWEIRRKN